MSNIDKYDSWDEDGITDGHTGHTGHTPASQ